MKKSELFRKLYENISEISESVGKIYDSDTLRPELEDESLDLGMPENTVEFMETALYYYSLLLSRELAAGLAETLAGLLGMEEDVNLFDPKTVEELVSDIEKD